VARISKSPKATALGGRLSAARTAAKLSQREVARRLNINQSEVSRWEGGERTPEATEVAAFLAVVGVTGAERDEILEFAAGDLDGPSWLAVGMPEQGEQLKALLQWEQMATDIVDWSPQMVPGLLQIGSYARAVMRDAEVPEGEAELRVAVRVGRSEVLRRPGPVRFTALISEAVLYQRIGGAQVMADQFDHIVKMCRLDNVDVRIVPLETPWHQGLDGGFLLLTTETTSVVHLENRQSGVFLQAPASIAAYKEAATKVLHVALDADQSSALIASEAERIRS
jgi:transcriptional regulator with XRE-family HTH domain